MLYQTLFRKSIASFLITGLITMINPVGTVSALATITEVTTILTPSSNTTPSYVFNSDGSGTLLFGGPCTSLSNLVLVGNNTVTFEALPSATYTTCTLRVDDGGGPGNILTIPTFIIDNIVPAVTLTGSGIVNIFSGSIYTDSGAFWSDNNDGTGNVLVGIYGATGSFQSTGTVNTSITGAYIITYLKVDAAGNSGSVSRTVNVLDVPPDTTSPVVNLNGSGIVNIFSGSTYTDSGASWSDNNDGTGNILTGLYGTTGSFQSTGTVNTSLTGAYIITYLKVDAAGNTGSVSRTVNVLDPDTILPIVTLIGPSPTDVFEGSIYTDPGASWSDNVDGTGNILTGIYGNTGSFQSTGTVDTFTVGIYTITYLKVDTSGNSRSVTRTVNVINLFPDLIPPVVTLTGSGIVNILSGSMYTDSGASWSDNNDGTGNILTGIFGATGSFQSTGTVNTSLTGTYTITYLKVDAAGNSNSVTRTVNVLDTLDITPPVIILNGPMNLNIALGSSYIEQGANWTDNIDGSGSLVGNGVVNTGVAGLYVITYNYTDSSGNVGVFVRRFVTVMPPVAVQGSVTGAGGWEGLGYGLGYRNPVTGGGVNDSISTNSAPSYRSISARIRSQRQSSAGNSQNSGIENALVSQNSEISYDSASQNAIVGNNEVLTISNPLTDYICPTVNRFHDINDDEIANVSEGEYAEDVQALLMFRSTESDDVNAQYSQRYILQQKFGIVKSNELYDGNRAITRADFVKMLVRALSCHYVPTEGIPKFSDVSPYAWYSEYIDFATEKGWMNGYEDGTFRPHDLITRAEVAKILGTAIQLDTSSTTDPDAWFKDVPENSIFTPYIYTLNTSNIIEGKTDSFYDMSNTLSRNEVARIFHRVFLNIDNN